MKHLLLLFLIFSSGIFYSQEIVTISIKGYVKNYSTKENLFGSTIYIVQNGKTITKAVSESNGAYVATGKVKVSMPFDVLTSKPGFSSKKVLVDLKSLKLNNANQTTLQLFEELSFELYENRPNVDLSFTNNEYAEKFVWDQDKFIAVPEGRQNQMNSQVELAYDKAKNVNLKLTAADSTKQAQNDANIETQIKTILAQADQFAKANKHADAMAAFAQVQTLVAKAFDQKKFNNYIATARAGAQSAKSKKDAQDLAFNDQLQIAKDKIALGRSGLTLANSALNSVPMKSRATDPEVIALKDQISKLQQYYKDRDAAYKIVKSKKNNAGALTALQNVFSTATANSKFTLSSEISQLKKSIDSLNLILNPSNNQTVVNNTTTQTVNKLSTPGQKSSGNAKDAFNNLDITTKTKAASKQEQMENAVNDVSYENSMNKKLNEARASDDVKEVNKWKDDKDQLILKEDTLAELRQYQMEDARQKNEYEKYKLDSLSLEKTYVQANQLQQLQIDKEVHDKNEKENLALVHQSQKEMVDQHINQTQMQREEDIIKQRLRQSDMETAKNDVETALYLSNTENRKKEEQRMYDQQNIAADKPILRNQPNYLADSNGNIYANDSTYEEVYELKNEQGFVETVIIRRIVVDHYGYGLVYEQTKNAQGKSSYTRNGFSITEFEWQNESKRKSPYKK
ncbi:MAG: hypothetical protein ACKO5W_07305 [Crocinitomicaceae bacterium]